jgi:twitching motility protein PilT
VFAPVIRAASPLEEASGLGRNAPIKEGMAPAKSPRAGLDLNELLRFVMEQRASDLHVKVGSPPFIRVDGHLQATPFDVVNAADTERMAFGIMPKDRADEFMSHCEADFAHSIAGMGRFRVNVFRQRGSVGLVFRRVLPGTPSFEALGLPPVVRRLADEPRGMVLVTGPTGSGKTTSIAAMIDHINESKAVNIVTIEDPIEVLHPDKNSIVNQRELGTDTNDYAQAMKRVLRQDPDVIFIGEMRDPETVWAALAAAETGHLVLSTLHTTNATETVNRIVDFFPPFQQKQVRLTLASSLRGVISQRLLERADGSGRIPAVEVMVMTGRVFERVVDPELAESIEEIIAEGEYYGMQTFDQSLFNLYKNGLVTLRDAMSVASHPHDFRIALQQAGLSTS